MISRRGFVTGAGIAAGALVMGFNPVARQWVTAAEAATTPFADLPPLDGEVVYDAESREANSRDLGRIIFRTPNAIPLFVEPPAPGGSAWRLTPLAEAAPPA